MLRLYRTSLLAPLLLLACASSSAPTVTPEPDPASVETPAPPPKPALSSANQPTAVVASARLVGDCHEPASRDPACLGSSLNLKIHNNAGQPQPVTIRSVKLVRPEHEAILAELFAVDPQHWEDDHYGLWDGNAAPGQEENIRYDLSAPSWSAVEANMGGGEASLDQAFRLIIEVSVGGEIMTIFSPTVFREYDDMVVT